MCPSKQCPNLYGRPLSHNFTYISPPSSTKQNSCPKINGPQKPTDHKASSRLTPGTTLVHTHPSPGHATIISLFGHRSVRHWKRSRGFSSKKHYWHPRPPNTKAHADSTTWERQLERSIPTENNTLVFSQHFLITVNCRAMTTKIMMQTRVMRQKCQFFHGKAVFRL